MQYEHAARGCHAEVAAHLSELAADSPSLRSTDRLSDTQSLIDTGHAPRGPAGVYGDLAARSCSVYRVRMQTPRIRAHDAGVWRLARLSGIGRLTALGLPRPVDSRFLVAVAHVGREVAHFDCVCVRHVRFGEIHNTNRLARRLSGYGVKPKPDTAGNLRGYYRASFTDAFNRYLQVKVSGPSGTVTSPESRGSATDSCASSDTLNRQTQTEPSACLPPERWPLTVSDRSDTPPNDPAPCGHPSEFVNTSNGKCGMCILATIGPIGA
jgi:Protein of unknown function (DUF3631)